MSAIIEVRTNQPGPFAGPLICSACGNRQDFYEVWVGDILQRFSVDPDSGERNWDSHDNEGEGVNIAIAIQCCGCSAFVAERDVTLHVGMWRTPPASPNKAVAQCS